MSVQEASGRCEARYVYDALGRRIAKEVNGERTVFGWDGDTLAYESDERGSTHYEPGSFVPLAQYVTAPVAGMATPVRKETDRYAPEDDPLQRRAERVGDAHVFYYHCDQIGPPLLMTDDASEVVWEASYKAWGETQKVIERASQAAGITPRNPIRFQGQQYDDETGLNYNRHRYYDAATGRFISTDPISLHGGLNLYQYVADPTRWIDPLGLARIQAPLSRRFRRRTRTSLGGRLVNVVGLRFYRARRADAELRRHQTSVSSITSKLIRKEGRIMNRTSRFCVENATEDSGANSRKTLSASIVLGVALAWTEWSKYGAARESYFPIDSRRRRLPAGRV